MPSEAPASYPDHLTGRCYCGASSLSAEAAPLTVALCHCTDCRRWTGAPVAGFAALAGDALRIAPDPGPGLSVTEGVRRWSCPRCGSPLMAVFDYLPGQVYVPLGLLDQAAALAPALHSHADAALPWLHVGDGAPRAAGSARDALSGSGA